MWPARRTSSSTSSNGASHFRPHKSQSSPDTKTRASPLSGIKNIRAVRDVSPLTVGMAQGAFAALMLAVWAGLERRVPSLWPFITFFCCGSMIDLWLHSGILGDTRLTDWVLMLVGVGLCALGSAYIIMSGIGIRAMDTIALAQLPGQPFWLFKAIAELTLLVVGWALGGPVGVGTLFFLVFVGFLIQPVMTLNGRLVGLPNYALGDLHLPADPLPGRQAA